MCFEEARVGSEKSCGVEDELGSVGQDTCILIMNGKRNIILKTLLGSHIYYINRNLKHLMLKISLASLQCSVNFFYHNEAFIV